MQTYIYIYIYIHIYTHANKSLVPLPLPTNKRCPGLPTLGTNLANEIIVIRIGCTGICQTKIVHTKILWV